MTTPSPIRRLRKNIRDMDIRQDASDRNSSLINTLNDQSAHDYEDNDSRLSKLSIHPPNLKPGSDHVEVLVLADLDVPKDEKRRLKSDEDNEETINDNIEDKTDDDDEQESVPLPVKKTVLERYYKSKQRKEQIKSYTESMIKETREERATQRAKIREREGNFEDEHDFDSLESSPSKKVRFKV